MIGALFKLIPGWVWLALAGAVLLVGIVYTIDRKGYERGAAAVQAKWDAANVARERETARLLERNQIIVEKRVVEYRDRIKTVEVKGETIIQQIPQLVPLDSPLLSGGFRVLHDSAARGEPVEDPAGAAAAAPPVGAAALAGTVARNYEACRANAEQLTALQAIIKETLP